MSSSRADPLWTIDATLRDRGFLLERPPATYRGPISVHGDVAIVEIEVPDYSFVQLPIVRLVDGTKLARHGLAHLTTGGTICYVGEAGLPLDLYNPGGSILRVLLEAAAALEKSYGGNAETEFEAELASYWQGSTVSFAVQKPERARIVLADVVGQRLDGKGGIVVVPKGGWLTRPTGLRAPATILFFDENLRNSSPFPFQNLAMAFDYIGRQKGRPSRWQEAVLLATEASHHVLLAAPNAIIGWTPIFSRRLEMLRSRQRGFRKGHFRKAVEAGLTEVALHRVTGIEADLRFCVERNLGGPSGLIGKKIAVIGCGTIGGYLSRMLVQTGAGCEATLHLYDTDRLSPGNLGRHILDFEDIGRPKAVAVAERLRLFHPDLKIEPHVGDGLAHWPTLQNFDLVIDATGEPNVATALNEHLIQQDGPPTPAILHSWVFGNGVAAQSFLNLKDGLACYRCLKTGYDGDWRFNPLKDPNSPLRQAPARCGEAGYVPFAVDAPVAAAGLAARAALDWANGSPGHRLRTTIVDHAAGREKVAWVSPAPLKDCSACAQ